jgi:hypothetical protein
MMSGSYNDEMYQYFINEENYKKALDLIGVVNNFEMRLRDEFWQLVTNRIDDLISTDNTCHFNRDEGWFTVKKDDWKYCYITTDNEDVGIRSKDTERGIIELEKSIVKALVEKNELIRRFENTTWVCWKRFNYYRYDLRENKPKILPSVRVSEVKKCADDIYAYLVELIRVSDEVNSVLDKKVGEKLS